MRVNNALVAGLLLISCGLACSKKKVPESGGHVPLEFDLDIGNGATNSTAGSKKRSVTVSQTGTQGVKSEGVSAQNVGYLEREKLLFLTGGKHAAPPVAPQPTFPDSERYIPLKFDLSIGDADQITTVEGNTTDAQTLAVEEGQFAPGISAANEGFVKASGSQFILNGNPWYCAGTNAYYAGLKYIMSDNEVFVMMKEHARQGATVLRVFAFSNFDSVPDAMMPDFGVYNEEAIRRLDLMLLAAAESGIRLVMVMANYWPFLGNMQDYVDRGLGPGKHYSLFYSDPTIRGYYKNWLRKIITRTNSITGQKYSEDPTVFSWELANEPRVGNNWEKQQGLVPGRLICDWVAEMSRYIKRFDKNHLVSVGDEGFRTNGSSAEPHSWINTGYEGVDFQCNLAARNVDFGTVHAYPDAWAIPSNGYTWLKTNFLDDRARIAKSLNKPLILEEYGMRAEGYLPFRGPLFNFFHKTANAAGYAGTLTWAVSHYSTDAGSRGTLFGSNDGQGYVYSYDGDGSQPILAQYQYQRVCTDIPRSTTYTCAQEKARDSTFPESGRYVPLKFDLGIGDAAKISTLEGENSAVMVSEIGTQGEYFEGVSAQNIGFVKASGTQFVLDGKPYWCAGTNAYYAGLKWIMSDGEVAVMMKEHAQKGANVLRIFAFSNFDSVPDAMMPSFGTYNEDALRRLDLAMVAAAENGIRLIMVMSNYWPFLGNMQDYVDRALGPGKHYSLFYTDPTVKQYYKDWLNKIITRTNTITGQVYKNDPTVLAWELANEPRIGNNWEKNRGLEPGLIVCNWVKEMSAYVKSLDSNHMVTVGDEGMRSKGNLSEPHAWINNGYEGVDFECNLSAPNVDFGTVHAYADQWGIPKESYTWMDENYFKDRASIARNFNKPLILEEYGMMREGYLPSREPLFQFFHDSVNDAGYACTLVWAVSHYSTDAGTSGSLFGFNDGQGYVFPYTSSGSFNSDGAAAVERQYQYMQAKNGGPGGAPERPPNPPPLPPPMVSPPPSPSEQSPPPSPPVNDSPPPSPQDTAPPSPPMVSPPPSPSPSNSPPVESPSPTPTPTPPAPASPSPSPPDNYSPPASPSPSPPPSPTQSPLPPPTSTPTDPTRCLDVLPPGTSSTCQEMRSWGQCDTLAQSGYCRVTCATCP
ncbi:hypothetical protein KSW81_001546 [Nannochloris sp. 'desiccata']|nr:hypothetical protein KSW81_001546 [Chlorella desiccata (nom. nud.)]